MTSSSPSSRASRRSRAFSLCFFSSSATTDTTRTLTRVSRVRQTVLNLSKGQGHVTCILGPFLVFRHGDVGSNWYVCLSGSVDVVLPGSDNSKVRTSFTSRVLCQQVRSCSSPRAFLLNQHAQAQTLVCTLGSGTAFGESILYDMPRNATIVTSSICELLRLEQKDFKILRAVNYEIYS